MIVIARKDGQLGNKLKQFAHFIAVSEETGVSVCNPCFGQYAAFFETTCNDPWCRFPLAKQASPKPVAPVAAWKRTFLPKITYRLMHLWYGIQSFGEGLGWKPRFSLVVRLRAYESIDLSHSQVLEDVRQKRLWVALGWRMFSQTLLDKHQVAIREFFRPLPIHMTNVARVIEDTRRNADLVAGVHIRQGDYAQFKGGRFYYQLADYRRWMDSLVKQRPSQRVKFLVCGNGAIDPAAFEGLDIQLGTGQMVEDLYALAETDMIIGPPSTFSGWASFYGQKPLISLSERNQEIQWPTNFAVNLCKTA